MVAQAEAARWRGAGGLSVKTPDPKAMAAAIRAFLGASGLDPKDAELKDTPSRVAQAWMEDYLDGYAVDPAKVLGKPHPTDSREMVVLGSIDFHSMCPHHLIPYRGLAHVAYVPRDGVVGFGRIVQLVDAFAHRLILQEQIAEEVTATLMTSLGAAGAGCVLDAEQGCVTMRGPKRRGTRAVTRAFKGTLAKDKKLQGAFLKAIP